MQKPMYCAVCGAEIWDWEHHECGCPYECYYSDPIYDPY